MEIAKPSCPRCGYDLSGVVESWRESCPLEGVCSECGLDFDWVLVLRPRFVPIPGPLVVAAFVVFGTGLMWFIWWLSGVLA